MGQRRKARESALRILFQLEFNDSPLESAFAHDWKGKKVPAEERRYGETLVREVLARKSRIDALIQSVSRNWRVERMVLIDRNILRIAVYELMWGERLAPGIVINEAVEIAKKYSGEQSAQFINGILDALSRTTKNINARREVEEDA
jgi:N utilization substance protein B